MINWDLLEERWMNRSATEDTYYNLISERVSSFSEEDIKNALKKGVIFSNYNDVYDIIQNEIDVTDEEFAYLEEECEEEFGYEWSMFAAAELKKFKEWQNEYGIQF